LSGEELVEEGVDEKGADRLELTLIVLIERKIGEEKAAASSWLSHEY
jgi:hypothetical protein